MQSTVRSAVIRNELSIHFTQPKSTLMDSPLAWTSRMTVSPLKLRTLHYYTLHYYTRKEYE